MHQVGFIYETKYSVYFSYAPLLLPAPIPILSLLSLSLPAPLWDICVVAMDANSSNSSRRAYSCCTGCKLPLAES